MIYDKFGMGLEIVSEEFNKWLSMIFNYVGKEDPTLPSTHKNIICNKHLNVK